MITANELRINNWVKRTGNPIPLLGENKENAFHKVNPLMIRDCEYYGDNWAFEPIPLTPEILESCGFKTYECDEWRNKKFSKGRFMLTLYKNGRCMFCVKARDNVKIADIFFTHQLQNLYFALTGDELEIKELTQCNPLGNT